MAISRGKLYAILSVACIVGYSWLFYEMTGMSGNNRNTEVCFIKHVTNIPCPSCGATRSVIALWHGNFLESLYINPIGILVAIIMLLVPGWVLFDVITKKETLLRFYSQVEKLLKKPGIAVPLVLLVLINWIWNLTKGL